MACEEGRRLYVEGKSDGHTGLGKHCQTEISSYQRIGTGSDRPGPDSEVLSECPGGYEEKTHQQYGTCMENAEGQFRSGDGEESCIERGESCSREAITLKAPRPMLASTAPAAIPARRGEKPKVVATAVSMHMIPRLNM